MLVDTYLKPSRLQPLAYWLALSLIAIGILTSSVPLWLCLLLIITLTGLSYWWMQHILSQQSPLQLWQEDSRAWRWVSSKSRHHQAGQLIRIHDLGLVIALQVKHANRHMTLLVWRDQVKPAEWQKLKIVANLLNATAALY